MRRWQNRQAGMIFIVITLFLDVLGLGIIIPILPSLVTSFVGGDESQAASYYGMIASSFAAMQFLFAPLLGSLSDRYGRRPVLLLALAGFGVNYLMLGLAPSLTWLFVARIFSGITGASFTTGNAYIADVSDESNRAQNFGMVGAVFGLGFIAGPAMGGLLGSIGPRVPFFVSAAIVGVNLVYGYFVLPESLAPENRRPFSFRRANPLGGLALLGQYKIVAGLALALVFFSLAQRGLETVWVLYTSYRYGWSELNNGMALALVGVMAALVQGGLIRKVVPLLGERRTVLTGLAVTVVGFVAYGLASQGWMMLAVVVFASLGGMAAPAIQGIVAGKVAASEQGAVQGTLTSLISLTAIVAPLISTQLFSFFTGAGAPVEMPGMPFFAGAVFAAIGLVVVVVVFRRNPQPAPHSGEVSAAAEVKPASA